MTRAARMKKRGLFGCMLGVALLCGVVGQAVAQVYVPDYLRVIDRDYGRRLRHAPAYRGSLDVRSSFKVEPLPPRYEYRFFDHPEPSFQFFQRPQTFKYTSYFLVGPEPHFHSFGQWGYWGPPYGYWDPSPPRRCCERCPYSW